MLECEFLCRNILYIFGWHTRAFVQGETVLDLAPHEILFDPASPFIDDLLENRKSCFVKLCASNRYFLVLTSPKDNARIVIGPVGNTPVTKHSAQSELYEYGVYDELLDEYFDYRNQASCYSHSRLSSIAVSLQYALSGEKPKQSANRHDLPASSQQKAALGKADNVAEIIAFENEYLALIELGDEKKLRLLLNENPFWNNTELVYDTMLTALKTKISSYIFLASRTVMRAGVEQESAYDLCEKSSFQIESSVSAHEVYSIFRSASAEFAKMVAGLSGGLFADRVREHILKNPERRIDTEELAELFDLSRPYFCKKFKEETGKAPAEFALEIKIDRAKQLLARSNNSLAQIADQLAFSSQSHFQNCFKKTVGITPAKYRAESRNGKIRS